MRKVTGPFLPSHFSLLISLFFLLLPDTDGRTEK
jgi:hypothetical protein